MEINIKKEGTCSVVEIKGRLDTSNFATLEKALDKLIEKGEMALLLDCMYLDYVSSSGLRVFLVALKKMKKLHGKFLMCNLQESIQEIFEVSGFISIFDVYGSKEEAMQNIKN